LVSEIFVGTAAARSSRRLADLATAVFALAAPAGAKPASLSVATTFSATVSLLASAFIELPAADSPAEPQADSSAIKEIARRVTRVIVLVLQE
jgi:hypothetical protein